MNTERIEIGEQAQKQDRMLRALYDLLDEIEKAQGGPDDLSGVRSEAPERNNIGGPGGGN